MCPQDETLTLCCYYMKYRRTEETAKQLLCSSLIAKRHKQGLVYQFPIINPQELLLVVTHYALAETTKKSLFSHSEYQNFYKNSNSTSHFSNFSYHRIFHACATCITETKKKLLDSGSTSAQLRSDKLQRHLLVSFLIITFNQTFSAERTIRRLYSHKSLQCFRTKGKICNETNVFSCLLIHSTKHYAWVLSEVYFR